MVGLHINSVDLNPQPQVSLSSFREENALWATTHWHWLIKLLLSEEDIFLTWGINQ